MDLVSRRNALLRGGAGFGAIALSSLLANNPLFAAPAASAASAAIDPDDPLAPKLPHLAARAKSVIFLFMEGGPSHLDSFDYKPKVNELAGQPVPPSMRKNLVTAMGEQSSPILASKRKWSHYGESGLVISDWLPNIAQHADDLAVIRSCWANGINHSTGVCQMNTGAPQAGRPSLGAWVTYGLGTENQNLPAFVVMQDRKDTITNGPRNWSSGFMPSLYQGTPLKVGEEPISNLNTPKGINAAQQRGKLDFLHALNERHMLTRQQESELDARIRSYELAFRMQAAAPEAVDLARESSATKEMYGLNNPVTESMGRNCLLARRLVERGVRFVQVYHGAGSKWDAHSGIEKNHGDRFAESDQPIGALLTDLKQRGLLESTLVVWGGEFGRTPMSEKGSGRDHNPTGFTMVMAGGGVRGGQAIGATDELGLHAIEDRLHVHDLHATVMRILGVDHTQLIYRYKGRPERIDINEGEAYEKIMA
ncbi:MAG: DUF1501 domain-containing protein [Phycisphaera sp.]|nr:DUF1501 domain-containing protein [Phycisphaera sp.]